MVTATLGELWNEVMLQAQPDIRFVVLEFARENDHTSMVTKSSKHIGKDEEHDLPSVREVIPDKVAIGTFLFIFQGQ